MAEHSIGSRSGVGVEFKRAMYAYGEKHRYRDHRSQKALDYYKKHSERREKQVKSGELGSLGRILLDDAQNPNATRPAQWEVKKSLGEGGYGFVTMWERYMGPEREPLRIALKETAYDTWFKDFCEEASLTKILNNVGCLNVVKVIDWRVYSKRKRSRILYEYCRHGTLDTFTSYYQKKCRVTIPEAFIWHVFHSLATALCFHAHGTTAEEGIAGWEAIIHRDIKPANILMADPDLNNRPLYPTIKLADYGLAFAVHNENVRTLKNKAWSGGTMPYAAPEVISVVRTDPNQAPHELMYPESDVFSVGCIILEMLRIPYGRYHETCKELIDYEYPFSYDVFPYSNILMDLAMDCVRRDVRLRPKVREVYKRTKYYADLWYRQVSGPGLEKPQEAYAGQVLWSQDLRNRFETNMHFRWKYTIHNDWFYNHTDSLAKLHRTAFDPGKANIPPDGEAVGLGNSYDYPENIRPRFERPTQVFNRNGDRLKRKDGKEILRWCRSQLSPPEIDVGWKLKRADKLHAFANDLRGFKARSNAEEKMINRALRELVAMHDESEKPTWYRLEILKKILDIPSVSMERLDPSLKRVIVEFIEEMRAYLTFKIPNKPRYTPNDSYQSFLRNDLTRS